MGVHHQVKAGGGARLLPKPSLPKLGVAGYHFSKICFGGGAAELPVGNQVRQPDGLRGHHVKAENPREIPGEHLGASAAHYYVPVVQSQARQDGSREWPPGLARRVALLSKLGGDHAVQVRFGDQFALQALRGIRASSACRHPGSPDTAMKAIQ